MGLRFEFKAGNWASDLASAIEQALPGDTIVVHTQAMRELGERAALRQKGETNGIVFEIGKPWDQIER